MMPFARVDMVKGKPAEYRAALGNILTDAIIEVLKAPPGDRFVVIAEHPVENLMYDPTFLGMDRSPDFILIQVTSTVGNTPWTKLTFYQYISEHLTKKLGIRPDDIMISLVFVAREDWSFGKGLPWA